MLPQIYFWWRFNIVEKLCAARIAHENGNMNIIYIWHFYRIRYSLTVLLHQIQLNIYIYMSYIFFHCSPFYECRPQVHCIRMIYWRNTAREVAFITCPSVTILDDCIGVNAAVAVALWLLVLLLIQVACSIRLILVPGAILSNQNAEK